MEKIEKMLEEILEQQRRAVEQIRPQTNLLLGILLEEIDRLREKFKEECPNLDDRTIIRGMLEIMFLQWRRTTVQ